MARGWCDRPRAPILPRVNGFFSRLSPIRAVQDLRIFLSHRQPYELGFLVLAIAMTMLIIAGFVKDSHFERPYKRDIIYVQSWRADRSDAEVRAQLAKDAPIEKARRDEFLKAQEERKASFKRYDDALKKWGL